jgi:hypothetical protein
LLHGQQKSLSATIKRLCIHHRDSTQRIQETDDVAMLRCTKPRSLHYAAAAGAAAMQAALLLLLPLLLLAPLPGR